MLTVRIDTQSLDLAGSRLHAVRALLPQALIRGVEATTLMYTRVTINAKLTEANPPYLNQRTGRLAFSVAESIKKERATLVGDRVVSSYGTNVHYGIKHERGGVYREVVPGHLRRVTRGTHRRLVPVREHTQKRRYRARRMFAHAIADLRPHSAKPMRKTIAFLVRKRVLPSVAVALAGTPGASPARIKRL
jgi:hypothetical protein